MSYVIRKHQGNYDDEGDLEFFHILSLKDNDKLEKELDNIDQNKEHEVSYAGNYGLIYVTIGELRDNTEVKVISDSDAKLLRELFPIPNKIYGWGLGSNIIEWILEDEV